MARHEPLRFATTLAIAGIVAATVAGCTSNPPAVPPTATAPASVSEAPRSSATPAIAWPTHAWRTAGPETAGLDSRVLADGLRALRDRASSVHSLLIARGDAIVLDAYAYPYDGSIYHDLASVTKSVTTTLIGIAADRGLVDLDAPILSYFPGRSIANRTPAKERITVRHLAAMTSGLDCRTGTREVTLEQMQASDDWVGFALDLPMAAEPGTSFAYCSPGMHLLSAILTRATGQSALDFARANLFDPLGIVDAYWPADPQGVSDGWGDLALKPRDMAKLGLLFLEQGRREGRQVVSAGWVAAATGAGAGTASGSAGYGYGWWISRPGDAVAFFRADGRRGQHILVIPSRDLIVVSTGGGFSLDEAMPFIQAAATNGWKALPPNAAAESDLRLAVAGLGAGPATSTHVGLPAAATTISGRTVLFDANPYALRSARLTFAGVRGEAQMEVEIGREETRRLRIGLDDRWRPSAGGRPILARGRWTDPKTFEVELDEGPGFATYRFRLRIEGAAVSLQVIEAGTVTIRGHLQA